MLRLNDSVLYQVAQPVTFDNTDELKSICKDMESVMLTNRGIGLAAPQVGVNKMAIVTNIDGRVRHFFNATFIPLSDEIELYKEGCLSFPDLYLGIKRPTNIEVKYQDILGAWHTEQLTGLLGRCLQHEVDHLSGVTFQKRASKLALDIGNRKLNKFRSSK